MTGVRKRMSGPPCECGRFSSKGRKPAIYTACQTSIVHGSPDRRGAFLLVRGFHDSGRRDVLCVFVQMSTNITPAEKIRYIFN
jgi:hypothetical protein